MSDPQSTDPVSLLARLSNEEAARCRAAGDGNDAQIRTGRIHGRIVRDNVFNFINNLFYVLGAILLALGKPLDAFVVVFVTLQLHALATRRLPWRQRRVPTVLPRRVLLAALAAVTSGSTSCAAS